eukprot:TRINITY_DN8729_c0_g1_i1.p1 TRINITY_DN8729_c0_g1~~TRINITY_DN8729_c0_g1_i1.p1  ORF type:complete len:250 (-),score=31.38 TRINITY_DN8729_c0_g1_i1:5-652(-)
MNEMCRSYFSRCVDRNGNRLFSDAEINQTLASPSFQIALADSGGLPGVISKTVGKVAELPKDMDWGKRFHTSTTQLLEGALLPKKLLKQIILASIARPSVFRCDVIGDTTFDGLQKRTFLLLAESNNKLYVQLPFAVLRYWCGLLVNPPFPFDLLKVVSANSPWHWQDFECIFWHFLRTMIEALATWPPDNPRGLHLRDVLRGAVGDEQPTRTLR